MRLEEQRAFRHETVGVRHGRSPRRRVPKGRQEANVGTETHLSRSPCV